MLTQEQMKSMEGGTLTVISTNTNPRFNTINQAVKYLDDKYGRINWVNSMQHLENIKISGMDVYVDNGLRCDPDSTQYTKYRQWQAKYPELSVRLS